MARRAVPKLHTRRFREPLESLSNTLMDTIHSAIEIGALGIEALAVAVILIATAHGTISYILHMQRQVPDAYEQYKVRLGKALLLGLELLVAADIIRTVALEPTLPNVMILAVLVVVRTFLSWSLVVEIEGHWPWKE
jgi:uncharacterized membrane protein